MKNIIAFASINIKIIDIYLIDPGQIVIVTLYSSVIIVVS